MKKILFIVFFLLLYSNLQAKTEIDKAFIKRTGNTKNQKFLAYSPDIYETREIRNNQVYDKYGCQGNNLSPKIVWKNAPDNTKSFAITMYTDDTNNNSGWWHWIIYNIPANVNLIESGANNNKKLLPKGAIQGLNDYGERDYGGVCPPFNKKYNYVITIYALDIEELDLSKNATPAMIVLNLNNHKIATTTIKSSYTGKDESTLFINKTNKNVISKSNNNKTQDNQIEEKKNKKSKKSKNVKNKYIFTGSTKQNKIDTEKAKTDNQEENKKVEESKPKVKYLNIKNIKVIKNKNLKQQENNKKTKSLVKNKSGKIKEYSLKSNK